MENNDKHTIKGIPVTQNKQDFIIGVFSIKQILKFTKYTERLITGFDEEEQPIYNKQIQRFVEKNRVERIADFLSQDPDATFPTNLVLHIPISIIEEQKKENGFVKIKLQEKVYDEISKKNGDVYITIIDGQHRIRGIEVAIERLEERINTAMRTNRASISPEIEKKLEFFTQRLNDLKNINLVVSFFIDKSLEYQAMIFSTINRTQKKVSADLVYSLFGLDTSDTPQKTALQVVLSLNGHPKSPFYKRIKLYGGDYSNQTSPPLSQATMVKSIISLISENLSEAENDRYRERKELLKRSSSSGKLLPFRLYYATDRDSMISDILFYYFTAVKNTFKTKEDSYWSYDNQKKPDNILQTAVGYEALLKILVDILASADFKNSDIEETSFSTFLSCASNLDFSNQQLFPFSTKGKNILYLSMSLAIWENLESNRKDDRKERLEQLLE
ncbi:DGQHR domain-containing protein [Draconibacterium orientale]|uniref:DGQHR domain-containing protein n=1 Tax=Draconibacterium orientale TaxID=1168034 RepID=UPI0029C01295|nr:DGQHR domain-containing protein [Draconibacterium orientale]